MRSPESKKASNLLEDWKKYEPVLFPNWFQHSAILQTATIREQDQYMAKREKAEKRVLQLIQDLSELNDVNERSRMLRSYPPQIQSFVFQRFQYVQEWLERSGETEVFYDPQTRPMLLWGLVDRWNERDQSKFP